MKKVVREKGKIPLRGLEGKGGQRIARTHRERGIKREGMLSFGQVLENFPDGASVPGKESF